MNSLHMDLNKSKDNLETTEEISEADYFKVDGDGDELLFTKQSVKQIMLFEKTVEIVGILGETEIRPNVMKFVLHNKTDDKIQILVWDVNIIQKIKSLIMPGNIIHIDGAFAKHRNESLSAGNTEYDLNIMSNTKIHLLKESISFVPAVSKSTTAVQVSFNDCLKYSDIIQITGYIKNMIRPTTIPNCKINQGCSIQIRNPYASIM